MVSVSRHGVLPARDLKRLGSASALALAVAVLYLRRELQVFSKEKDEIQSLRPWVSPLDLLSSTIVSNAGQRLPYARDLMGRLHLARNRSRYATK